MSCRDGGVVVFTPLCQGFLKKRKDKMRMRWVTYWFKLHNTTLFFYTKKHGTTSDLRGQYYLFEVESVHELMNENKRYLFEIAMKNGKRKVLAADTADLRQEWICQLLKAMKHPAATKPASDWKAEPDPKGRTQSNPCNTISSCRSLSGRSSTQVRRPYSIMLNSHHSITSLDSQLATLLTSQPASPPTTPHNSQALDSASFNNSQQLESEIENKTKCELENDYDILPPHKALNLEEGIYDTPPSNRRASEQDHEMADTIYDVPKFVFRNMPECVNEDSSLEERSESGDLLSDMMACLGENSADWIRGASPESVCKPQQWEYL